jgi:hypothetical protein
VETALPAMSQSKVAWEDYDQDDDLDLLIGGTIDSLVFTFIYRNDDFTFTKVTDTYPGLRPGGTLGWGDFNNDGYSDFLVTGVSNHDLFICLNYQFDVFICDALYVSGLSPDVPGPWATLEIQIKMEI